MKAEEHLFFVQNMNKFYSVAALCTSLAEGLKDLEFKITDYDNKLRHLIGEKQKKEAELVQLEKRIKERMAMADSGTDNIRNSLNQKHLELIDRENKVRLREMAVTETQEKANAILAAAEQTVDKKKHKIAA